MDEDRREKARHGAAMADKHTVAAPAELETESPADAPGRFLGHRLHACHEVERRLWEHGIVASCEEAAPARELGRRRPEPSCRPERLGHLGIGLDAGGISVGMNVVRARLRLVGSQARSRQPERIEDSALEHVCVGRAAAAHHDLAEQRKDEIRVVPRLAGRKDELCILESGDKLLAGR